jgi:hypothetical protein
MRALTFVLLFLVSGFASACQCMHYSLDRDIVQEAKDVVVFRVIGTGVSPDPADHMAVANIAVVDRIRGKSKIKRILYSTSWCCGLRIDAGGYYILFVDKASDSVHAHAGNLLAVGDDYDPAGMVRTGLLDVLAGRRAIDVGITEYSESRLPKIPPPPPPPCPDRKRVK